MKIFAIFLLFVRPLLFGMVVLLQLMVAVSCSSTGGKRNVGREGAGESDMEGSAELDDDDVREIEKLDFGPKTPIPYLAGEDRFVVEGEGERDALVEESLFRLDE